MCVKLSLDKYDVMLFLTLFCENALKSKQTQKICKHVLKCILIITLSLNTVQLLEYFPSQIFELI